MNASGRMTGYARLISAAIRVDDTATLVLVERLMRQETGGVLDHLSSAVLVHLARQAYGDATEWHLIGAVNGVTLADYCRVEQIDLPGWAASATEGTQA